jgi:hypothetical protein
MKSDPSFFKIAIGFAILSALFFVIERFLGRGRGCHS